MKLFGLGKSSGSHEDKEPERIELTDDQIENAEKFGFERSWYEDPVLIVREDFILVDDYKKQDFDLEEFYRVFKDNILNSEGNKIAFEDDL